MITKTDPTLLEQIKELQESIITKGLKRLCHSNIDKIKKLEKLIKENERTN